MRKALTFFVLLMFIIVALHLPSQANAEGPSHGSHGYSNHSYATFASTGITLGLAQLLQRRLGMGNNGRKQRRALPLVLCEQDLALVHVPPRTGAAKHNNCKSKNAVASISNSLPAPHVPRPHSPHCKQLQPTATTNVHACHTASTGTKSRLTSHATSAKPPPQEVLAPAAKPCTQATSFSPKKKPLPPPSCSPAAASSGPWVTSKASEKNLLGKLARLAPKQPPRQLRTALSHSNICLEQAATLCTVTSSAPQGPPRPPSPPPPLAKLVTIEQQATALNLQLVRVPGEGDCQFAAVSVGLHGSPDHHAALRRSVCDHIAAHAPLFSPFLFGPSTLPSYLAALRQPRAWGDELCLAALSDMLRRELRLLEDHRRGAEGGVRGYAPLMAPAEGPPVWLAFRNGHYNALVPAA